MTSSSIAAKSLADARQHLMDHFPEKGPGESTTALYIRCAREVAAIRKERDNLRKQVEDLNTEKSRLSSENSQLTTDKEFAKSDVPFGKGAAKIRQWKKLWSSVTKLFERCQVNWEQTPIYVEASQRRRMLYSSDIFSPSSLCSFRLWTLPTR